MKKKPLLLVRVLIAAIGLALLVQGFVWFRFEDVKVFDALDEFDPSHNVESYFDDAADREVQISWSRRAVAESFLMQAASWEALDLDQRAEIFITSTREACAS